MLLKYLVLFVTIHYVYGSFANVGGPPVWIVEMLNAVERSKRSAETQTESQATYNINCLRSEDHLNDCILKITNELLPAILKGIPKFGIPTFLPYIFGTIKQQLDKNLYFIYTGKALPSTDAKCYSTNLSIKNKMFQAGLTFKKVTFYGNFTLNGTINNKPVYETGYANFTYFNPKFFYTGHWNTSIPLNATGTNGNYTHKIGASNLSIVHYDAFKDVLYHINKPAESSLSDELELDNLEPAINAAVSKIGNYAFTLISDIFCNLIPDRYLLN